VFSADDDDAQNLSGDPAEGDLPSDDGFGLSSPPPASSEASDPFETVDGASSSNAGAFDSFSNQPVEVKEEEAEALKSGDDTRGNCWIASTGA
jgi:hypothetical protein